MLIVICAPQGFPPVAHLAVHDVGCGSVGKQVFHNADGGAVHAAEVQRRQQQLVGQVGISVHIQKQAVGGGG